MGFPYLQAREVVTLALGTCNRVSTTEITDLEFPSFHPLEVSSVVLTAIEQRIETL